MIDQLQLDTGIDIPCEELGITFIQPKIKDIAILGESNYWLALQICKLNKDTLRITSNQATEWTIFQQILKEKIDGVSDTTALMQNFFQIFLPYKIIFGPNSILLNSKDKLISIEPDQLLLFKSYILQIGGASIIGENKQEEFNPINKRAAEIADKMKRMRQKVAKLKAKEMGLDGKKQSGLISKYIKVAGIGTANSINDITNMTLLQLNNLVKTYYAWQAYDLDVKSRLNGAKDDKPLIHWSMRDQVRQNNFETI